VPSCNEEHTIRPCVERIFSVYPDAEVIVVEARGDATREALRPLLDGTRALHFVFNHEDRGKGHAVRVGVERSTRAWLAVVDADLQFLPEEIPLLLAPLQQGRADLVLGSRFLLASTRSAGSVSRVRGLGNQALSGLASLLTAHTVSDALTGFKAWRRELTDAYVWQSDRFSYEVELIIKACRLGFQVLEVPVTTEARAAGQSSVNVLRTGAELGLDMLRFRLARLP
jgi:glycosyltransferase involved in cell wall biosynthesis